MAKAFNKEKYTTMSKVIFACLGGLVLILGLSWIVTGNDFFLYKFFAPKQEAVRREVFENTPSFTKGMVQELEKMRIDYVSATNPEVKDTLASTILHRVGGFNLNDPDVPSDLRAFIQKLKRERTEPSELKKEIK